MNRLPWQQRKNFTINISLICNLFIWVLKTNSFWVIVFHVAWWLPFYLFWYSDFSPLCCNSVKTTNYSISLLHHEDFRTTILIGWWILTSDTNSNWMLIDLPRSDKAKIKKDKNELVQRLIFLSWKILKRYIFVLKK